VQEFGLARHHSTELTPKSGEPISVRGNLFDGGIKYSFKNILGIVKFYIFVWCKKLIEYLE